MSVHISINGVSVAEPTSLSYDYESVDFESTRTASGDMHRNMLGICVKLELSWTEIFDAEARAILNAVADEFFSVSYYEPKIGGIRTSTFYSGTPKLDTRTFDYYGMGPLYKTLTLNLIEKAPH